ncbi:MAG: micrococcal nuclease [Thermomicrobiales bacterium]|nr:micrococcal nuclease [Thermomicrobiales bacterium]
MGDLLPAVGRPRGSAWRALHTEGIVWEGQVLIVGAGTDLATRLIVTHQRLAFARGGAVALDIERAWLRPAPTLNADGTILLLVTLPDTQSSEPIRLMVMEGRRSAAHLVSLLTGAGVRPVTQTLPLRVPETVEEPAAWPPVRSRRVETAETWESPDVPSAIATLDADDFPPLSPNDSPVPSPAPEPDAPPAPRMVSVSTTTTNGVSRNLDWSLQPVQGMSHRSSRQGRRGWVIRLSGLVLLVAAAAYGASQIPDQSGREIASRLPGVAVETPNDPTVTPTPATSAVETATKPSVPTATVTNTARSLAQAPTEATVRAQQTAIALGVGGPNSTIVPLPDPPPTNQPRPTNTPAATATTEPTATTPPTETTAPTPTEAKESTTVPTPETTDTVAPTDTAVPTETLEPTQTPTSEPTPTAELTTTPQPTRTPNASPTPTATSIVRAQRASLAEDEVARQVVVAGDFRYTIEAAIRGVELPELALPNPGNGEWVVLVVDALNWSDENAALEMADFRVAPVGAPGSAVAPDVATDAIASFLGFVPAFKSGDSTLFAPAENHRVALVFLVSPGLGDLTLLAGESSLDLAFSFAQPAEFTDLSNSPKASKLLEAKVTKVIDGQTIEVEVDGEVAQVNYLGITVPTGDACYATEATAANEELVAGKTVWLEREWKNRASKSAFARDVWVDGPGGSKLLVAAELAARGAATPSPVEPDIRYAGMLSAAASAAQFSGLGIWSACGGPPPGETAE